jgi:PAS domain S-box-containing protein
MTGIRGTLKTYSNIYEKILYSLPDIIFIFDREGYFLEFYNENENLMFLKPENFIGKRITETDFPDNIIQTTLKILTLVSESKQDKSFKYFLEIEGEKKFFEARFFPIDNEKIFTVIRSIDDLKKGETVQKNLKENYQKILDRLENGIVETDSEGKINYANKSFLKLVESEKSKLIRQDFFDFMKINKEKEKMLKKLNQKKGATKKQNYYVFETDLTHTKIKKKFRIHVSKTEHHPTCQAIFNFDIVDITEERKKQEILEKSENTYRNLVETSPNGILIRDDNNILYANPAAIQMLGFKDLQHACGFHLNDLYLPEFIPILKGRLNDIKKGIHVDYTEVKIKRPIDGKIIEIETIPAKIYYEGRDVFQIVIKDVSLQKRLLEARLRADIAEESYDKLRREIVIRQEIEQKLSNSLEEKNILLKEVHHRVKNNLQIISSILNLEMRSQKDKNVGFALKRIQNRIYSIYLIHEIVYQTDMFSRIDLGQYIKLISENMSRNSEHEIATNFKFQLEKVNVSLEIGVPIGMIINELLSNYFDYYVDFESDNSFGISLNHKNMHSILKIQYPELKETAKTKEYIKSSLSSQLIEALVDQINGSFHINAEDKKNLTFVLQF